MFCIEMPPEAIIAEKTSGHCCCENYNDGRLALMLVGQAKAAAACVSISLSASF